MVVGRGLYRVRKETGSQVSGSWNKEARSDSSFYQVSEANWIVRACSMGTECFYPFCTPGYVLRVLGYSQARAYKYSSLSVMASVLGSWTLTWVVLFLALSAIKGL